MPNLIDIVLDTFPANNDVGVPLLTTITVVFNGELDQTELQSNFFVEGPDTDQYVGPGILNLTYPDNVSQGAIDGFLTSPGYKGIVGGDITFEWVDVNDSSITVSGSPYNTKLIFTPTQPLVPLFDYTATVYEAITTGSVLYSGIVSFDFQSGSGSIETIPASISTSPLKTTSLPGEAVVTSLLEVSSTTPTDHSIEVNPSGLDEIIVTFNETMDDTSFSTIGFTVEPILDHPALVAPSEGNVDHSFVVSGTDLTISGFSLTINSLLTVTVPAGVKSSTGVALAEDFEFQFMTTADPAYTSLRKVYLELGSFVSSVYDDTIMMAILEASLEADVLTYPVAITNTSMFQHARRQYVTCLAAWILGHNVSHGLKSKTLGDLRVEYDPSALRDALDRMANCMERWLPQVMAGGYSRAAARPTGVVKGDLDPDRPIVSRGIDFTPSNYPANRYPAANTRDKNTNNRRYLRTFARRPNFIKWW